MSAGSAYTARPDSRELLEPAFLISLQEILMQGFLGPHDVKDYPEIFCKKEFLAVNLLVGDDLQRETWINFACSVY